MKDSLARDEVANLKRCVDELLKQVVKLTTAHNELFDHIAPKLGFEAAVHAPFFMDPVPVSPRTLKTVTTTIVVDHKPCKREPEQK